MMKPTKSKKQQKANASMPSIPKKRNRQPKKAGGRRSGDLIEVAEYVPFRAKPSTITRNGKDSAVITFCQPLTTIQEAASGDSIFVNSTLADTYASNGIVFGPSTLNGPLLNNCQPWTEYRFRSVKIKYHPACPSTTSGAFAIGVSYAAPAAAVGDLASFAAIQQANVGYSGPFWQSFELSVPLEDPSWKRVDYTIAGELQDVLGAPFTLCGRNSSTSSGLATRGYLTIHGTVEVRSAVPLQGVTMQVRTKHDALLLKEVYKMLCPVPDPLPPIASIERDVIDEVVARMTELFGKVKPPGSSASSVRSWN